MMIYKDDPKEYFEQEWKTTIRKSGSLLHWNQISFSIQKRDQDDRQWERWILNQMAHLETKHIQAETFLVLGPILSTFLAVLEKLANEQSRLKPVSRILNKIWKLKSVIHSVAVKTYPYIGINKMYEYENVRMLESNNPMLIVFRTPKYFVMYPAKGIIKAYP